MTALQGACRAPGSAQLPCAVRTITSHDVEDYTLQLADWELEYDQLDRGPFVGELFDVRLGGMQLFAESTSRCLQQRGTLMPSTVSLAAMLAGQGDMLVNGVRPGPNGLAVVHDGRLELTSPAECRLMGVMADEQLLQGAAIDLLGHPLKFSRGLVTGVFADAQRVAQFVAAMQLGVMVAKANPQSFDDPLARAEVRDAILVQMVHVLDHFEQADEAGRSSQRKRLVDRACALMLARPDEASSLDDICHEVGASVRKLNYCFQDVVGMSPTRYIRTLRLNSARRELRRSGDAAVSVYDVASRWGFWHFGRFSCEYKRQFCESPSQSLKRARPAGRQTAAR